MADNQNGHNNEIPFRVQPELEVAHIPCASCGNLLEIIEQPFTVMNGLTHSVLIVEHKDAIVCTGCGATYCTGINPNAKPVTSLITVKKAERRIVLPN
jgi:hypothetical protein